LCVFLAHNPGHGARKDVWTVENFSPGCCWTGGVGGKGDGELGAGGGGEDEGPGVEVGGGMGEDVEDYGVEEVGDATEGEEVGEGEI